jgi:hypothetical protein
MSVRFQSTRGCSRRRTLCYLSSTFRGSRERLQDLFTGLFQSTVKVRPHIFTFATNNLKTVTVFYRQDDDKEQLPQRSCLGVRKTDEPEWDRRRAQLLGLQCAELQSIKGRHEVGGDLSHFLLCYRRRNVPANNNRRFPQFSCVAWVPEERRDRNKPIQYVVTASPEFERKFAELQDRQKSQSERGQGELPA